MTIPNVDREGIAKLRREIRAKKGIADRADTSADLLRWKASSARGDIRRLQQEIRDLGGVVRS